MKNPMISHTPPKMLILPQSGYSRMAIEMNMTTKTDVIPINDTQSKVEYSRFILENITAYE